MVSFVVFSRWKFLGGLSVFFFSVRNDIFNYGTLPSNAMGPQMSSRCKTFSSQGLKPEKPSGLGNCWLHVDHGMYHLQREVYRLFGAGFGGWWRLGLWCSTYNLGTNLFLVSEDAIVTLECHFICHFAGPAVSKRKFIKMKSCVCLNAQDSSIILIKHIFSTKYYRSCKG